jgi:hypothetical protein
VKHKLIGVVAILDSGKVGIASLERNANIRHAMRQAFGRFQPCDIGKRVYLVNGVFQIENDQQLAARLGTELDCWIDRLWDCRSIHLPLKGSKEAERLTLALQTVVATHCPKAC